MQGSPYTSMQFYLYLIVYLLLIHFKQAMKQELEAIESAHKATRKSQEKHASRTPGQGIVMLLGKKLSQLWL
ncbi:MAG: hypothetical protein K9L60_06290 [Methylovulum sp.]|jgi:flagellar motor component MotA|nr:hypothetical protein [Methylovulum sp.]MCF7998851.1 hypothetical protein [Methylovulum sp.]